MFSSNEKISGRQAFRLLVFDLLGLGTLLIPAAVAGFCGRDGIFCIIVGTVLGLLFLRLLVYAVGDMQGSFAEYTEKMCGTFTVQADQSAFLDRQMRWKVEKGDIDAEIGSSSEDIRLKGTYRITEDKWINGMERAFYAKAREVRL